MSAWTLYCNFLYFNCLFSFLFLFFLHFENIKYTVIILITNIYWLIHVSFFCYISCDPCDPPAVHQLLLWASCFLLSQPITSPSFNLPASSHLTPSHVMSSFTASIKSPLWSVPTFASPLFFGFVSRISECSVPPMSCILILYRLRWHQMRGGQT